MSVYVDAPLTEAEAGVTPGFGELHVVDTTTGKVVEGVVKADTKAGMVWRSTGFQRAHPWLGSYKLVCSSEVLERYRELWKAWK